MHKHLRRLDRLWLDSPIYFITMCTKNRSAVLARDEVAEILIGEWDAAHRRHGWAVGRYVNALGGPRSATAATATALWQREFFDHVLCSSESYSEKWNYVFDNPVRAGLVSKAQEWRYAGEIKTLML